MNCIEKIDFEYQIFFLDCMRQSKAGIYARSDEIHIKKQISNTLKKELCKTKGLKMKMESMDNILEEVHRYVSDHKESCLSVDDLVKRWIKTL